MLTPVISSYNPRALCIFLCLSPLLDYVFFFFSFALLQLDPLAIYFILWVCLLISLLKCVWKNQIGYHLR
jgi:hypothetical protein